jgi:hypothetical protein
MELTYEEPVMVEYVGSPKGKKIVKAKATKGGVKVKAEGTPMELLTVAAVLIDKLMWENNIPLHEVLRAVEQLIEEGATNG